ncbi:unnamed protein product [Parajaminaea phylloscopi]
MALPRTHRDPATHHYHHHHHHHHHHHNPPPHRKKRGNLFSQPGPLRQLQDEEDDLAGAMGGGSSRDASEEDNDAFSEQSDSASTKNARLAVSPTQAQPSIHALPTTARDRALAGSRPCAATSSSQQQRRPPIATGSSASNAVPESQSPLRRATAVGSSQPVSSGVASGSHPPASLRRPSQTGGPERDPAVAATLTQASIALSSSSSVDLSRYGADDEDTAASQDGEAQLELQALDEDLLSSTDALVRRDGASTARPLTTPLPSEAAPSVRAAAGPLNLSSLPTWQYSSAQNSSTPTPLAMPSPRGAHGPASASSAGSHAPQSINSSSGDSLGDEVVSDAASAFEDLGIDSEADADSASSAPLDSAERPHVSASSTGRSNGAEGNNGEQETEEDASDGGTASPYDGDVEFAAPRTPLSQGGVQLNAVLASAGASSSDTIASAATGAGTAGTAAESTSQMQRNDVRDVPCRAYGAAHTDRDGASAEAQASPSREKVAHTTTARAKGRPLSGGLSIGSTELSAEEIHAHLLKLNEPEVLAQFQSEASTSKVKLYVEADFDIAFLSRCTSLLRTAKLCLVATGNAAASETVKETLRSLDVVAGIPAEYAGDQAASSASGRLPMQERASLARSCRWVDEVVEGVPRLAAAEDRGGSSIGGGGEDSQARMRSVLADVGAQYFARFVKTAPSAVTATAGRPGIAEVPSHRQAPWEIRLPC